MSSILYVALLSASPIIELRGSIPLGIGLGLNPILVLLTSILFNFLVVSLIFFFLDTFHSIFMRHDSYKKHFNQKIEKKRKKFEKHIGTKTEFWALMIFVGIPLPMTGAWTGSILAWFFGIKRRKAYLAIFLGIVMAGIIMTLLSIGIFGII
jgi:uncharacterized membrane protein